MPEALSGGEKTEGICFYVVPAMKFVESVKDNHKFFTDNWLI